MAEFIGAEYGIMKLIFRPIPRDIMGVLGSVSLTYFNLLRIIIVSSVFEGSWRKRRV